MRIRADDEVLVFAGVGRHAVGLHTGKLLDGADLLIVPAGHAQRRHIHVAVLLQKAEVVLGMVGQPVVEVRLHAGEHIVGNIQKRQEPEPLAAVLLQPNVLRVRIGGRPFGIANVDTQVRRQRVDGPPQHAAEPQHPAKLAVEQVRGNAAGVHGRETRRSGGRKFPLCPTVVGVAKGADLAGGTRQSRRPLHRVVAIRSIKGVAAVEPRAKLAI